MSTDIYNPQLTNHNCGTAASPVTCYAVANATDQFFVWKIAPIFVLGCALFAVFWGLVNALIVKKVVTENTAETKEIIEKCIQAHGKSAQFYEKNPHEEKQKNADEILQTLNDCGQIITKGAVSFLNKEYLYLTIWSFLFAIVLGCTVDLLEMNNKEVKTDFPYTAVSYLIGSLTSIIAGYIGMRIAVYTNTRVTFQCALGATKDVAGKGSNVHEGFITAFSGGEVLGFVLVGLALLNLMIIVLIYRAAWWSPSADGIYNQKFIPDLFTKAKPVGTPETDRIYMSVDHYKAYTK
jgi:hypothetical protein